MDEVCAEVDELLSGYLDGELTQKNRQRVELYLERCARYAARLRELDALRASVGRLRDDMDPEDRERWRKIMDNTFDRTIRGIGWLLVVGAALLLIGYGGYEFILSDLEPPFVKWGGGRSVRRTRGAAAVGAAPAAQSTQDGQIQRRGDLNDHRNDRNDTR